MPPPSRHSKPLSRELLGLIERVERDQDVRNIITECRRRYPEYRALSGPALDDVRQNVGRLVAGFYQFNLIEGRLPTMEYLAGTIASARARVEQGVSLWAMIGTYQLSLPIMWDHLIDTLAPNPRVRIELLRRVPVTFTTLSHVTTLVTEAYVTAREQLLQSRGEVLDEFLRLLVTADVPLPTLDARAREFGLDLAVPRVAVFFRRGAPVAGESAAERETGARLAAVCAASSNAIVGRIERDLLALLSTNAHLGVLAEVAGDVADHRWSVGVGRSAADAAGLRRSALEARRAIELGTLLRRPPPTYRYADLEVHDLVDVGSPRALSFAHQTLGTLARSGAHGRYRETLQALCAQGFRVKPAAAALGIHPHTLSYRVKQMRDRHGLDLDDPHTRLRVELALLILDS